jgi:hydrogenase maturation factor
MCKGLARNAEVVIVGGETDVGSTVEKERWLGTAALTEQYLR